MRIGLFLPAVLMVLTGAAQATILHGTVTHVTDGDTLWVRAAGASDVTQIRLQGIDAPEICQAFGLQAREALAGRVLRREVRVTIRTRDAWQRAIGRITVNGQDLGAWLVAGGHAWSSRYQQRAGPYAREEAAARAAGRGLWANGEPLEPRQFRQRHGSCHLPQ